MIRISLRRSCFAVASAIAALAAQQAGAQAYPTKPVRFVVSSGAGGLADTFVRVVGNKLQDRLGQPVVVENRAGAGGLVAGEAVAKSPADGYTILQSSSAFALFVSTVKTMPFDLLKDLTAVTKGLDLQNLVVAGKGAPFRNLNELVAYAKANPGKLSFGATGIGTTTHLGGELLKQRAGIDMVMVPYKATQQTYAALMSGEVQLAVDSVSGSLPHIRSGAFTPIVIVSDRRSPVLADVPTAAEAGLAGVQAPSWIGFMAPAGTPPDIVSRLQREIATIIKAPDVADQFRKIGAEPIGNSPEDFGRTVATEVETWARVVRDGKLKFD